MTEAFSPGRLAQVACLLEATARKPGNVHRFRDFKGTTYLDFALSALAIGEAIDHARQAGVGATVLAGIRATRALVATNTNLGMILLLAPLACVEQGYALRSGVASVLARTTVEDARSVYEAIRLAQPGGLGSVADQDVADTPTGTLLQVMTLAADRDGVARQYATGFADVFDTAVPRLTRSLAEGQSLETAIVLTHLTLLAGQHDTLIARKLGLGVALDASRLASGVLSAGWPDTTASRTQLAGFDDWLRADGHARNPGTTADLVTAALFVALRDGTIPLPLTPTHWMSEASGR